MQINIMKKKFTPQWANNCIYKLKFKCYAHIPIVALRKLILQTRWKCIWPKTNVCVCDANSLSKKFQANFLFPPFHDILICITKWKIQKLVKVETNKRDCIVMLCFRVERWNIVVFRNLTIYVCNNSVPHCPSIFVENSFTFFVKLHITMFLNEKQPSRLVVKLNEFVESLILYFWY